MKIGIFDSGLGGLNITKTIHSHMPDYDYMYLGDTLHVPYGNRSQEAIYNLTLQNIQYLFEQDCALIIIACNTASAAALRIIQQQYLPNSPYKNRRVLGVVVPMIEEATDQNARNIGLIATNYIVNSGVYEQELQKINPDIQLHAKATPLLVPLLEDNGDRWIRDILIDYLEPLLEKNIDSLILGCTHYALLKPILTNILPKNIKILSQDDIIPLKLAKYLQNHPEIDDILTKNSHSIYRFTDLSDNYTQKIKNMTDNNAVIEKIVL